MRKRFFIKNFLVIFLPALFVVCVLGGLATILTLLQMQKQIELNNQQTANRISESTELIFSEADALSLNYSVSPTVMLRMEKLLQEGYTEENTRITATIFKTMLDSSVNTKNYLHSVYVYLDNPQQNFFASLIGLANADNMGDTAWLEQLTEDHDGSQQWLQARIIEKYPGFTEYKEPVITVYKQLFASGRTSRSGALVMNIHTAYLQKIYQSNLTYDGQALLMTDQDGKVLCGVGDVPADTATGTYLTMNDDLFSTGYYVQKISSEAWGTVFWSVIPHQVLGQQYQEMLWLIISVILLALLMSSIAAFIITRKNTRSISSIIELLAASEKKEPLPEIVGRNDIYGFITQNILKNYLASSALGRELLEKKLSLQAMQFSLLQAQLNPHFLFNTLKTIYWKSVRLTGTPNDTSHMIELLTSVLHYNLTRPEALVSIEEELRNTQKYVEIQQTRFDHRFQVDWRIAPAVRSGSCIKFLLQPLVENSISHGLGELKNGSIMISIEDGAGFWHFMVADNGKGMTAAEVSGLLARLSTDKAPEEHLGLYNVNKRLVLAYTPAAALQIKSIYGKVTIISFSIPKI
ncbi:histidine kinase [Oscillospiraceae bacterium HV4-5-C5C]|nr:histidine kinase [Oscillospiraceae bacterium HV4-5-C5C]